MSARKELFLSYSREPEVASFVTQLKHDLERSGFSVWLDAEDIPAGCDWHAAIGTGLDECRALIAVVTKKYISSRYCTSELYTADGDRKSIFPIIFEEVDFSTSQKARGVKYVISGINWTMFRPGADDYHTSFEKLIQGMREQGLGSGSGSDHVDAVNVSGQMAQLHLSPHPQPADQGPYGFQPPSPSPPHPHSTPPHSTYPYQQMPPGYNYPPHSPYSHYPHPHHYTTPPSHYYTSPPHMQAHGYYPPHTSPTAPPPVTTPYYPPHTTEGPPPVTTPYYPPHTTEGPPPVTTPYYPPHTTEGSPPITTPYYPPHTTEGPPPDYSQLYPVGSQPYTPTPQGGTSTAAVQGSKFKVGMKLESGDRRFPYYVCVATIMDRSDDEVLIHFDGWDQGYDYWCPQDSVELHPVGWCERHGWKLQTPLNQRWSSWKHYLEETEATPADDSLFNADQLAGLGSLLFQPLMRVEAKDRHNPTLVRVATIADIKDGQLLIHFDGLGARYDYWCRPNSTDIHPVHWCQKHTKKVQPPHGYSGVFKWNEYLTDPDINPAPAHLFTEEQRGEEKRSPGGSKGQQSGGGKRKSTDGRRGGFEVGMRLEAKDRMYPTLVCVATITDMKDGQLLIHFDGWNNTYDYWCRPDSTDIHPIGWAAKNGVNLQQPKGYSGVFEWSEYLTDLDVNPAPAHLFTEGQQSGGGKRKSTDGGRGAFEVGMRLEAKDRMYPTLVCVATITGIKGGQLLIHFDGWNNTYDYWCRPDSTDIHPIGWAAKNGVNLQQPKGYSGVFEWSEYLTDLDVNPAPAHLFTEGQQSGGGKRKSTDGGRGDFQVGMRLEAKDRMYPTLVCVATIADIKGGQLLIHFDGWSNEYDYWCRPDSTDIHPIGWAGKYGVDLQQPNGMAKSNFSWRSYLKQSKSRAAPDSAFTDAQK